MKYGASMAKSKERIYLRRNRLERWKKKMRAKEKKEKQRVKKEYI